MTTVETHEPDLKRLQSRALVLGVVALALSAVEVFLNPTQFFRSYLFGIVFWTGAGLGCLGILMLHHMVGGRWGFVIRRFLESGTKGILWMAVLFVPILFGLPRLYTWAQPAAVAADPILKYKTPYLNVPFFVVRTVIYFAAWIILAYLLRKRSAQLDQTGDREILRSMNNISGLGMLIYAVTVTYASVDWVMSMEPRWFSTIYGMMFMVSQALAAISLVTILTMLYSERKPLSLVISRQNFHDYGNLMLTFTMLWAYLSFSQYLIIWAGNMQDEIPWYVSRATGSWAWVALALIVFHFAVPFLLLLSRYIKKKMQLLSGVAALVIVMSVVDLYWLSAPAYDRQGPRFHWADWTVIIGLGGLWLAAFASHLKSQPLLPLRDPRFEGMLQHES